ncbi:MAG: diguanylate cyclase, partial [Zoogloeaceae bacterium]|nr:diguanylate cyclase [Zoogloeaceae bacterium]
PFAPSFATLSVDDLPRFRDWECFLESGLEASGFFLEGYTGASLAALLGDIRRSRWWYAPVIGSEHGAPDDLCWLDAARPLAKAGEFVATIGRRQRNMPDANELQTLDERLLYFLYARGAQATLVPLRDRDSPRLYRYPVAELLAQKHEDIAQTVEELQRRGLLEAVTLLDRTRHCRQCGSAHIHFLDVCPHCGSIDIHQSLALHCFSCGHVAPETEFLARGAPVCPKCQTSLRHIGVDYDRPMAQYACRGCRQVFIESEVVARCLDCDETTRPSELDVREVCTLALTTRGKRAVRAGEIHETFAALNSERYVDPVFFRRMLDWMLETRTRHNEFRFTLMLLEFTNAEAMVSELGGMRLYMLLDEFAHRLLALLRTSDLTSRTHETRLWLLLPYTSAQGLAARMQSLLDELSTHSTIPFTTGIRYIDVAGTAVVDTRMHARELMQQLETEDEA